MIGKGIKLSTGFDLNSQSPLDNRTIFETIEERDSLPNINLYEGLECFIKNTKQKYVYINGQWNLVEIWDNVIVTKDDANSKSTLSFYANGVLKKEVEIDSSSITADDIQFWDDATVTKDIDNDRNIISFYSKGVLKKTIYIDGLGGSDTVDQIEQGENPPTDENILLWIDTSSDGSVSDNFTDALIIELRSAIRNLNSEIKSLKDRVAYLEQNGISKPGETTDTLMTFEDGKILTFEDGTQMTFE